MTQHTRNIKIVFVIELRKYVKYDLLYLWTWLKPGRCCLVGEELFAKTRKHDQVNSHARCFLDMHRRYNESLQSAHTHAIARTRMKYSLYMSLSVHPDASRILLSPLPSCVRISVDLRVDRLSRAKHLLCSSGKMEKLAINVSLPSYTSTTHFDVCLDGSFPHGMD